MDWTTKQHHLIGPRTTKGEQDIMNHKPSHTSKQQGTAEGSTRKQPPTNHQCTWKKHRWATTQQYPEDCHVNHRSKTSMTTLHHTGRRWHGYHPRPTCRQPKSQVDDPDYHQKYALVAMEHTTPYNHNPHKLLNEYAGNILNEETGALLDRHLIEHPKYRETWSHSYGNKIGMLAQGVLGSINGKDIILPQKQHKDVSYWCIMCDYRKGKEKKTEQDSWWEETE